MKASLIAFPTGKVTQPSRGLHEVKTYGGYFAPMPAVSDNAAGVKLVSFCTDNAGLWHSYSQSHDPAVRTQDRRAADTHARRWDLRMAHCRRFGSRHTSGREALAILGTDVQARSHVQAMRRADLLDGAVPS